MLRTAWGGRGGGGRGRLKELGIGFAVLAYEYVGDAGTGGRALGEGGRLVVAILFEGRGRIEIRLFVLMQMSG